MSDFLFLKNETFNNFKFNVYEIAKNIDIEKFFDDNYMLKDEIPSIENNYISKNNDIKKLFENEININNDGIREMSENIYSLYNIDSDGLLYVDNLICYYQLKNILDYVWDENIKNKLISMGIGSFYKQSLPNFIIDDININNKHYELFIFESCNDSFGCPDLKGIEELLIKYIPEKISNIKINIIKINCYIYPLFCYLFSKINNNTKCYIIDTIGTGSSLDTQLRDKNKILQYILKNDIENYKDKLLNDKIIYYLATGTKIIFLNKEKNQFEGVHLRSNLDENCFHGEIEKKCELDYLNTDNLLNNNIKASLGNLIQSGGDYYKKYIKYKQKYLNLKQINI
jgi:hypothetical protein